MKETWRDSFTGVHTRAENAGERSFTFVNGSKSVCCELNSVSFHFARDCKEFLPGNYLINLREVGK